MDILVSRYGRGNGMLAWLIVNLSFAELLKPICKAIAPTVYLSISTSHCDFYPCLGITIVAAGTGTSLRPSCSITLDANICKISWRCSGES